jgi:phosphatidylglycerophosphate synthase
MNWLGEYKKSLKMKEVEEVFDLVFYRPVAFLFVRTVYNTEITPNSISIAAIFMGITAGCFYSLGQPLYFKIGAFFYLLFNILDCSDGQLARLKKTGTPVGRIIDGISDYIATIAVYLGIAVGFASGSPDPYFWLLMLFLAGLSNIIHGILVDYYRSRFLFYVKGGERNFEKEIEEFRKEYELISNQKGKRFDRMVLLIYFKYSAFQRLLVAKKKKTKFFITTPEEYFKKNKTIIRFWLLTGATTEITTLIICSFFNRFDLFIWIIVIGFNSLAVILWPIQQIIDKTFNREP